MKILFEAKRLARLAGINEVDGSLEDTPGHVEPVNYLNTGTSASSKNAEALARRLRLPEAAVAFIVAEFKKHEAEGTFDRYDNPDGWGYDNGDGRIGWGQSHEGVREELEDVLWDDVDEDTVDNIFDKFFVE